MVDKKQSSKDTPNLDSIADSIEELPPEFIGSDAAFVGTSWSYGDDSVFFHKRMPKTVHWSVPWSDLMMTMFILFAVLYMYQTANREFLPNDGMASEIGEGIGDGAAIGKGGGGPGDSPGITRIYDLSKQALRAEDLGSFAKVDLIPNRAVRIILTGDLLFDTGKAELKPAAKNSLVKISNIIRKSPYLVNVVGHTDNTPIYSTQYPTNWELSVIRASVVCRFLIEKMKIPGNRFYVSGHAYHQPVKANDSVKNRSANRRVEIIITKERPHGTATNIGGISG